MTPLLILKGMNHFIHRLILSLFILLASSAVNLSAQKVEEFVPNMLDTYPKSHLLDIYKSCFQDYMGAEHLVADSLQVKKYLDDELETASLTDMQPWYYEYCGPEGRHVRVSLRAVKEGLISEDMLLNAFIRSANGFAIPSVKRWKKVWKRYIRKIDRMKLALPDYDKERLFIDDILSKGKYAISHSDDYRQSYHPHYRIVERSIFDTDLKPLLTK